jgi:hypothetical protein
VYRYAASIEHAALRALMRIKNAHNISRFRSSPPFGRLEDGGAEPA